MLSSNLWYAEMIRVAHFVLFLILQNDRTCVLRVESIFKTSQLQNARAISIHRPVSNQRPHVLDTMYLPNKLLVYNIHVSKSKLFICKYLSYFWSWMDIQPLDRLIRTNKTCFARVRTMPKTILWIIILFLSYPCRSKTIQTFLSADQTLMYGVNHVFSVLEWNLIFVLLSKILDRIKRLFVVQFLESLFLERSGTYTFNSFSLALWQSRNMKHLFRSSKIETDKNCNQLLMMIAFIQSSSRVD